MKKIASVVSVIGGTDGPTSVFLLKKNAKLTLKQKIQRTKNKINRFYVEKTLSCESHSLDEVMEYIVNRYGFVEVDKDAEEFDIDFHKFKKTFDDINDNMHIVIEKKYAYIGGGVSGNKKVIKSFQRIYKDVYRYYGVTKEDKVSKLERYKDVVRTLSR